jgi:hypothetical protein
LLAGEVSEGRRERRKKARHARLLELERVEESRAGLVCAAR